MHDSPVGCHEPMVAFGKSFHPNHTKPVLRRAKPVFSFAWEEGKEIQPMVELAAKAHPTGLCCLLTGKRKVKQSKSTGG